ncbi:MAG: adenylate cyclase [Achromobacter sp.]|uniref:adenylate cyclase n=1 Tax=Achromobacter sp. TaxID=134375 RepID=UPI003CFDE4C1
MNALAPLARLRPLAAAMLMTVCAGAVAQTYAPPPAPAYDSGDPANANLAPVDRSPQPPPPLPVYSQPPAPGDGYLWVPGYWSLNRYGFFWVPGAWVLAPYTGALWTPGYWGFVDGVYLWHPGYWGPHIGFYGGINYGFGYVGIGYVGGYWDHDRFFYNRAVTNVNVTRVTNVYNHTVVVNNIDNRRISYHGGPAGIQRRADPRELAARNEPHHPPTDVQRGFVRAAGGNRAQFFEHNQGRPPQAFVEHAPGRGGPDAGARPGAGPGNGPGNGAPNRAGSGADRGPGASRPEFNRGVTGGPSAPQNQARQPQVQPQSQNPPRPPQAQPQSRPQQGPQQGLQHGPHSSPAPDNLAQRPPREPRAAPANRPEARPQGNPQHGGGRPSGGQEPQRGGGGERGASHEKGRD